MDAGLLTQCALNHIHVSIFIKVGHADVCRLHAYPGVTNKVLGPRIHGWVCGILEPVGRALKATQGIRGKDVQVPVAIYVRCNAVGSKLHISISNDGGGSGGITAINATIEVLTANDPVR